MIIVDIGGIQAPAFTVRFVSFHFILGHFTSLPWIRWDRRMRAAKIMSGCSCPAFAACLRHLRYCRTAGSCLFVCMSSKGEQLLLSL